MSKQFKPASRVIKRKEQVTPVPIAPAIVGIDDALKGRDILATYCSIKIGQARAENDLCKYVYYTALANTLTDSNLGLLIGPLIFDIDLLRMLAETADADTLSAIEVV